MAKASETPKTEEVVAAVEATAQAPFYSYKYLDGDEKVFATKDDLDKGFRSSYLRRQDFERQNAEAAKTREEAEKQLEEMRAERDRDRAIVSEYLEWDRRLRQEPGLYDRVAGVMKGSATPGGTPPELGEMKTAFEERIEKLEKMLEDANTSSLAERAFQSVSSKYQDFGDHADTVDELLARMESGDDEAIYEIAYHAAKGYGTPAQEAAVQAKIGESRAAAPLASSNGAQPAAAESRVQPGTSVDEARNIAYQELGIVPGDE